MLRHLIRGRSLQPLSSSAFTIVILFWFDRVFIEYMMFVYIIDVVVINYIKSHRREELVCEQSELVRSLLSENFLIQ